MVTETHGGPALQQATSRMMQTAVEFWLSPLRVQQRKHKAAATFGHTVKPSALDSVPRRLANSASRLERSK